MEWRWRMTGWEHWIIANTSCMYCKYGNYYMKHIFLLHCVSIYILKLAGENDTVGVVGMLRPQNLLESFKLKKLRQFSIFTKIFLRLVAVVGGYK